MSDPWADPRAQRWAEHCRTKLLPMIGDSAFTISVVPETPDAKMAVELGYAILLDKPIVLYCPPGRSIPMHLRRVADYIVEGDINDPATKAQMDFVLDRLGVTGPRSN